MFQDSSIRGQGKAAANATLKFVKKQCHLPKRVRSNRLCSWIQTTHAKVFRRPQATKGGPQDVDLQDNPEARHEGIQLEHDFAQKLKNALQHERRSAKQKNQAESDFEALEKAIDELDDATILLQYQIEAARGASKVSSDRIVQMMEHSKSMNHQLRELQGAKERTEKMFEQAEARHVEIQTRIVEAIEIFLVNEEVIAEREDTGPSVGNKVLKLIDGAAQLSGAKFDVQSESDSLTEDLDDQERQPDEGAGPDLLQVYQAKKTTLHQAEAVFGAREEMFDQERKANDRAKEAGEEYESTVSLDLRQLKQTQQLARRVAEAEEELIEAKNAALTADINLADSDLASGFKDDVEDGYRTSFEQEMQAAVDQKRIATWLAGLPDQGDAVISPETPERLLADDIAFKEWDAASVDIWESRSMVADGFERRKIDQWRQMAPDRDVEQ